MSDTLAVLGERTESPRLRQLRLFSPAVGRQVSVGVGTPQDWRAGDHGEYPVLYLLHGSSDEHTCWVRHTDMVRLAECSNALVVMPEAGRLGFYTNWKVPDAQGTVPAWETFHLDELPVLLEREYGASRARVAIGISMGGYGALAYAIRRPGMFRAVASLSGFTHLSRRGMGALLGLLSIREGMRPGRIWGPRRFCGHNWAAHDPFRQAEALRPTAVYLAAGDGSRVRGDPFVPGMGLVERYVRAMTEDLAAELAKHGAAVTTHFGRGTHFWPTWRRCLETLWPSMRHELTA